MLKSLNCSKDKQLKFEMSKSMYYTQNLTDKEYKEQGNRLFTSRKYDEAVSCYSKAIVSKQLSHTNNHFGVTSLDSGVTTKLLSGNELMRLGTHWGTPYPFILEFLLFDKL